MKKLTPADKKEIEITKKMIVVLKQGYGYPCVKEIKDICETCGACQAQKVIEFLKEHIKLIKL